MKVSFDDAGVHVIRQLPVNLGRLFEWVTGALEALVEVETVHVQDEADLHDLSNLGHLPEPVVRCVQVQGILQIPIHQGVIKAVEYRPSEHGFSIHPWEGMLMPLELGHEDCAYLDDELDEARVLDELIDLAMLPHAVLDATVHRLDKGGLWLRPALTDEALLVPDLHEAVERGAPKKVVLDG